MRPRSSTCTSWPPGTRWGASAKRERLPSSPRWPMRSSRRQAGESGPFPCPGRGWPRLLSLDGAVANRDDFERRHHPGPPGGALVAGNDEAKRTLSLEKGMAVLTVDKENGPAVEGVVEFGQRKGDIVVVAAMDQDDKP